MSAAKSASTTAAKLSCATQLLTANVAVREVAGAKQKSSLRNRRSRKSRLGYDSVNAFTEICSVDATLRSADVTKPFHAFCCCFVVNDRNSSHGLRRNPFAALSCLAGWLTNGGILRRVKAEVQGHYRAS